MAALLPILTCGVCAAVFTALVLQAAPAVSSTPADASAANVDRNGAAPSSQPGCEDKKQDPADATQGSTGGSSLFGSTGFGGFGTLASNSSGGGAFGSLGSSSGFAGGFGGFAAAAKGMHFQMLEVSVSVVSAGTLLLPGDIDQGHVWNQGSRQSVLTGVQGKCTFHHALVMLRLLLCSELCCHGTALLVGGVQLQLCGVLCVAV